jgi:hypothetical protein
VRGVDRSLHGYALRTALPDHGLRPALGGRPPDVTTARAAAGVPPDEGGTAVASMRGAYVIHRRGDEHLVRFGDLAAIRMRADDGAIVVHADASIDDEWCALLAHGNAVALLLALRGELMLHASAVALDGTTVAFAGQSGAGKTTIAAVACADGARLVSDDALRVLPAAGGARCAPGGTELRLRPAEDEDAARFLDMAHRRTVDGRLALSPPVVENRERALDVLVVPELRRDIDRPEATRRRSREAVVDLMRLARITNWRDPAVLREQFDVASRTAAGLPVVSVRMPWRRPIAPEVIRAAVACALEAR